MPQLEIPLRRAWVRCPEGRLVVRPAQSDGNELLMLESDNTAMRRGEVQIGVGTTGDVLVQFRDVVKPSVFERQFVVEGRTGLWVGNIEGTSGVEIAARPGRYLLSGWFNQEDGERALLVVLGVKPV